MATPILATAACLLAFPALALEPGTEGRQRVRFTARLAAGSAALERDLQPPSGRGGLAALVESADGREVLQALALPWCE